jgi:hypothetical protein
MVPAGQLSGFSSTPAGGWSGSMGEKSSPAVIPVPPMGWASSAWM